MKEGEKQGCYGEEILKIEEDGRDCNKVKNIFKPVARWKRFTWKKNSKQQQKEKKKEKKEKQPQKGKSRIYKREA